MSMATTKPPDLVSCSDQDFNNGIIGLSLKELLGTISILQKEMTREQENFNSLSSELNSLNKNSRQYKQIQKEMTTSQGRLTSLMNRSMKCFQQQGNHHVSRPDRDSPVEEKDNTVKNQTDRVPLNSKPAVVVQNGESEKISNNSSAQHQSEQNGKQSSSVIVVGQPQQNGEVTKEKSSIVSTKVNVNYSNTAGSGNNVKPNIENKENITQNSNTKLGDTVGRNQPSDVMKPSTFKSSVSVVSVTPVSVMSATPRSTENPSIALSKTSSEQKSDEANGTVVKAPTNVNKTAPPAVVYHMGRPIAVDQNVGQNRDQMMEQIRNFKRKSDTVPDIVKPEDKVKKEVFSSETLNVDHTERKQEKIQTTEAVDDDHDSGAEDGSVEASPEVEKYVSSFSFPQKAKPEPTKVQDINRQEQVTPAVHSHLETEVTENVSGNVEERKEDSGTAKDETDGGGKQKILSDEEEVGVPLVTEDGGDEVAPVRVNLSTWDPTKLLKDLYTIKLLPDNAEDISHKFIGMEGLMEKLPMNKKKATLLKTWKRRFFKAKDGWLYYYETGNHDKPSDTLQLMGGKVDDLGNRILGIDDGRGKYLMVRCPTDKEYGQWKLALESQTADNVKATYVHPVMSAPPHSQKKVVVIDIGSSSIRAGLLSENATLPQVFFPTSVAHIEGSDALVVGIEAYEPEHRKKSTKPIHPTDKLDKFSIDMSTIGAIFKKIFTDLKVESSDYWVMISTPQNLADKIRSGLMEILIGQFHVQGVCMVMQALLALYSYNATSGIIVDIGERMEILPIYDGFIIEGGVSRQSYGGQKVAESLNSCLHGYKFSTPIQQLIVRYVMEQSCYLALDYKDTVKKCESDPESYRTTVYLTNYNLPAGANVDVTHDYSCFHSPEGFFNTDLWGMDYPCVHKLVFQAIQSCPIDSRKRMYRAVYLSGGTTMLPGFAERLQMELQKLAPPSVMVEVHASPQRYHSSFIGACSLANMEQFKQICISAEEWKKDGAKAFKKWNMSG